MCFERRPIRLKAECSVVRVSIETVALAVHLQDVDVVSADGPAACLSEPKTPVHWLMGSLAVTKAGTPLAALAEDLEGQICPSAG